MNLSFRILTLAGAAFLSTALPSWATISTFNANGNTGFGGNIGTGSLVVADDGSGGLDLTLNLSGTSFNGNAFVLYLDTGVGGGYASTSSLSDTQDGAREAVSEFTTTADGGGPGRSTLNFNGILAPQYAITIDSGFLDVFSLSNASSFNFTGGSASNDTGQQDGASYNLTTTSTNATATVDIPAADLGLSAFSGANLNFIGLEVSETGFSSNEGYGTLTGNDGWGNTQTVASDDSFTLAVPEPSTVGLLACGTGVFILWKRSRRRAA